MATGDEEGEESEVYTITSAEGLEYDSTETISDIIFQIHNLVHGPKRDLALLKSLTEDLWTLAAINDGSSADNLDMSVSDSLGTLDSLDQLPAGWTSDANEVDDEGE